MRLTGLLLALLVVGSFTLADSSASGVTQPPKTSPLGSYRYTGYDRNGHKIVEGRLSITSIESDTLKGNWRFHKVRAAGKIGPQIGAGDLTGEVNEGEIYINLNPGMADNNVHLRGRIEGRRFHGTWSFDGFVGGMNKGTFEARKR
jgi:hypothetical protein